MKKYVFSAFVGAALLASCGSGETTTDESTKNQESAAKEAAMREKQQLDSINKALSAINVRVFNHEALYFDSDGVCMNERQAKITEIRDFHKTASYTCKQGNYIQRLDLEGVFNGIDIQFLDDKNKLLKEFKNYNLQNVASFSALDYQPNGGGGTVEKKDKNFHEWFEKAGALKMLYKDSVFYSATWKNSGWFIQ